MRIEWFEEVFEWKNPEGLYKVCIKQQEEIKKLKNLILEYKVRIKSLYNSIYGMSVTNNIRKEIKVMNNDEIRDFCIKKDLKIFELEKQLQQKENIIKELREYANKYNDKIQKDILEILDKNDLTLN